MPLLALLPIAAFFAIGLLLRRTGVADQGAATVLFRLVLNASLPALVFLSLVQAPLTRQALLLPLASLAVNAACTLAAMAWARRRALPPRQAGVLVLGACVTNLLFTFPFIQLALGTERLAQAFLYDAGNALYFATVAHALAWRLGAGAGGHPFTPLARTLRAPIFLAILAALAGNLLGLGVPPWLEAVLAPLGACTTPLVLIAVGIAFSPRGWFGPLSRQAVLLRMPLGLAVGLACAWLLGLRGDALAVVAICAAAPIGFNSVTLAAVAALDVEQAAAALSASIAVALFSTTALVLLAARWLG